MKDTMQPQTKRLLRSLDEADLFSHVGQPISEGGDEIIRVTSSEVAMDMCESIEWENFTLEESNRLSSFLHDKDRVRYNRWSEILADIKEDFELWLSDRLTPITKANHLSKRFADSVRWDFLGACMESEYADLDCPAFFRNLMPWYISGHFPCGWGVITDKARVRLIGPPCDPDLNPHPDDDDYLMKILTWPVAAATKPQPPKPEGRLVVF